MTEFGPQPVSQAAPSPFGDQGREEPAMEFKGVSKFFITKKRALRALDGVSFSVARSEFLCVVGPSGCGKSTLLNLIAGLTAPDVGGVCVGGQPVSGIVRGIGYITQRDTLLPWRTVAGNVRLGLETKGVARKDRRSKVWDALAQVGLQGFEAMHPQHLSGGMRKRLQLARTLVCEPSTVLLDEPFGALDAQVKMLMQQDLMRLRQDQPGGMTALFITHDLDEAVTLGDRVVVLSARPGRVVHVEAIDDLGDRSDVMALRDDPRFRAHVERIWAVLAQQLSPR